MSEQENIKAGHAFFEAWNAGDLSKADLYNAADFVADGPGAPGPLRTLSGGTIPPTGKTATLVGSTTAQVKNGKVTHTWSFWDLASLLGQPGLLLPM